MNCSVRPATPLGIAILDGRCNSTFASWANPSIFDPPPVNTKLAGETSPQVFLFQLDVYQAEYFGHTFLNDLADFPLGTLIGSPTFLGWIVISSAMPTNSGVAEPLSNFNCSGRFVVNVKGDRQVICYLIATNRQRGGVHDGTVCVNGNVGRTAANIHEDDSSSRSSAVSTASPIATGPR